jgi:hypothetical protein
MTSKQKNRQLVCELLDESIGDGKLLSYELVENHEEETENHF